MFGQGIYIDYVNLLFQSAKSSEIYQRYPLLYTCKYNVAAFAKMLTVMFVGLSGFLRDARGKIYGCNEYKTYVGYLETERPAAIDW